MYLYYVHFYALFFCFKQKTAYEMRISDWSSDVCSSDLAQDHRPRDAGDDPGHPGDAAVLFGYAINLNLRGLEAGIADQANTAASRALVMDMVATGVIEIGRAS